MLSHTLTFSKSNRNPSENHRTRTTTTPDRISREPDHHQAAYSLAARYHCAFYKLFGNICGHVSASGVLSLRPTTGPTSTSPRSGHTRHSHRRDLRGYRILHEAQFVL